MIFENHQSRFHVLDPYPSVLLGKGENHITLENNLPNELGTNNRATIKRSLLRTERISNNPMAWAGKEDGKTMVQQSSNLVSSLLKMTAEIVGELRSLQVLESSKHISLKLISSVKSVNCV